MTEKKDKIWDINLVNAALELTKIEIDVEKKFIDRLILGTSTLLGTGGIIAKLSNDDQLLKGIFYLGIGIIIFWTFWFILINTNNKIKEKFRYHYKHLNEMKNDSNIK